jgi:hypothetical protein
LSAGFDDDEAFKNLAKKREFMLHKLSWHCANLECESCDGTVHYKIKKFLGRVFSAATGNYREEYEDIEWDTTFTQVQLEGGVLQSKENTPEGSKCECFCHKPRPTNFVRNTTPQGQGKKRHQMLSKEEKEALK